ncbi:hypothetical protein ACFWUP_09410 [Nocardia sp. NPDC058658]|uniref:hypothetical protein n=1 Tax=Nocardia sp. NPDC058658 TaxID=3346580 RepID=UPI00365F95C4
MAQLPESFQQNPVFAQLYGFGRTEGAEAQSPEITSPQVPASISPEDRVVIEQSVVGQLLFDVPSTASVSPPPPTQQELDTSRVNQILPEGVTPPVRGGPAVVWVDGNNTQGSLFIDEFGVRHWDYLLANGVSIKVEQGGGSDGADRPWTNTKITQPGASVPVVDTYATQGVTSYIDTVDGRDVNVVLFQGGDIGLQTQDAEGGIKTTQITPSGPYSTYTSRDGTTWQSAFENRLFTRFSGTDGSESEESGSVDRRGRGEGYFTYPNGIRKNYTTVDGVITAGHYVDREGIDLGRFSQVDGIITFTPSQLYIDSYIREQGVTDMRVVLDPANGSAQTYYRLVNLADEQQRGFQPGDIPGIDWMAQTPQRQPGIIEHFRNSFSVIGDELSNHWSGPLIATMNARAGSGGIYFPDYRTPAAKQHAAGEILWAAADVVSLAAVFLPIPGPGVIRWLAGLRKGATSSTEAVIAAAATDAAVIKRADDLDSAVRVWISAQREAQFELSYTQLEMREIAAYSIRLGMDDATVLDMVRIASRVAKPISSTDLVVQMGNWTNVVSARGYPYKFTSRDEYARFASELDTGLVGAGIPSRDAFVQGSSLRTPMANDVDIAVFVPSSYFDSLLISHFEGKVAYGAAESSARSPIALAGLSRTELEALSVDIKLNPALYNSNAKTFGKAVSDGIISSKSKISPGLKQLAKQLAADYPHLNVESISILIKGGKFDTKPALRIE